MPFRPSARSRAEDHERRCRQWGHPCARSASAPTSCSRSPGRSASSTRSPGRGTARLRRPRQDTAGIGDIHGPLNAFFDGAKRWATNTDGVTGWEALDHWGQMIAAMAVVAALGSLLCFVPRVQLARPRPGALRLARRARDRRLEAGRPARAPTARSSSAAARCSPARSRSCSSRARRASRARRCGARSRRRTYQAPPPPPAYGSSAPVASSARRRRRAGGPAGPAGSRRSGRSARP